MKIILLQNVKNLGNIGTIKEVKDGYALNYLIPNGLASLPNDKKAAEINELKIKEKQKKKAESLIEAAKFQKINGKKFTFDAKADENGKLYGSIGPKEMAPILGVDEKILSEHFKQVGIFPLKINFGKDMIAEVKIEIIKVK